MENTLEGASPQDHVDEGAAMDEPPVGKANASPEADDPLQKLQAALVRRDGGGALQCKPKLNVP